MTTNAECDVSANTQTLIDLLRKRDALGLAKYGVSLDRTDLSATDWIQHAVEELLDGAAYLTGLKRTLATARDEVHRLRKCLDVAQMAMVAVVQYADSLGPCEVRDRLLEIAKTRPATAADRPEQQARLAALKMDPHPQPSGDAAKG